MDNLRVVEAIKKRFFMTGSPETIPLLKGLETFTAELTDSGVQVDNLWNQPFLPWIVSHEIWC